MPITFAIDEGLVFYKRFLNEKILINLEFSFLIIF